MQSPHNKQHIDLRFLADPSSRWQEFLSVARIAREFIYGFWKLHFAEHCVTFFGSAHFAGDQPYYKAA